MKQLIEEELEEAVTIIRALAGLTPLRILQYVENATETPTIEQIAEALGIEAYRIRNVCKRLEDAEIVKLTGETFVNPEPNIVLINTYMPDLAQAIVCEIWPDWEVTNPIAHLIEKTA